MAFTEEHSFKALSSSHYEALGRLLVGRNEFIDRCATVMLVAQFGLPGRSSFLQPMLSRDSVREMTDSVESGLRHALDKAIAARYVEIVAPFKEVFGEIDRVVAGRWGLVDFTAPERPVLYADDTERVNLRSYAAADIERLHCELEKAHAALKVFLIPPDAAAAVTKQ